ncbi:MAG: DUF401 family protein [Chitinivibrionales bacterium]|nr:DUF401 family protein [Chitinivibrionales bacterium]
MELLLHVPVTVKVGLMFAAILGLNRLGVPLAFAVIASAIGLVAWSGAGLAGIGWQIRECLDVANLLMLLVILLLLFFTEALRVSGRIPRTVEALRGWLNRPRLLLAGLPALIGLLPMPGGALVSAPMVASVAPESDLAPEHKIAINYWFRHIWEYWWPLYPGVVLALRYSGLPVGAFYLLQAPFTLAAVAGGIVFLLRGGSFRASESTGEALNVRAIAAALWPIATLVAVSIVGAALMRRTEGLGDAANLWGMLLALLVALTLVFLRAPQAVLPSMAMFRRWKMWSVVLVVAGVQLFSAALAVPLSDGGGTLVSAMADELAAFGIPTVVVMAVIPFVAGLVTGVAVGFVGVSFPLVFGILGQEAGFAELAATTALAYGCGYAGMMLSPIHICFVVTGEYFKAPIAAAYRYLAGPLLLVAATAVVLSTVYRLLGA